MKLCNTFLSFDLSGDVSSFRSIHYHSSLLALCKFQIDGMDPMEWIKISGEQH